MATGKKQLKIKPEIEPTAPCSPAPQMAKYNLVTALPNTVCEINKALIGKERSPENWHKNSDESENLEAPGLPRPPSLFMADPAPRFEDSTLPWLEEPVAPQGFELGIPTALYLLRQTCLCVVH